jgi:hypothetical protein
MTKDGGLVAVGTTKSNRDSIIDTTFVWVTKLDAEANSPSPPPTAPTATPNIPELSWLVIVPLLLSVAAIAVIFRNLKAANRIR